MLNYESVIWITNDITVETLERVTAQLHYLRTGLQAKVNEYAVSSPPRFYFRSNGGDSRTGIAIANMIARHGDGMVQGWLVGDSGSTAATIWASCPHRYVMPNSRFGIHPVTWQESESKYDASTLRLLNKEFEEIDRIQCQIYAAASNRDFDWWWKIYNEPGDVKWFSAEQLVDLEMAELILPQPKGGSDGNDNTPYPAS